MPSAVIAKNVSIGGVTCSSNETVTNGGLILLEETLVAAKAGVLTTRTDANTGVITSTGHGMTVGTVSVYWTVATVAGSRNGMTISSGDANTITLDGGAGDDFPAEASAVTIFNDVILTPATVTGNDVQTLVVNCTDVGAADFQTVVPASLLLVEVAANVAYVWTINGGTNPLAGVTPVQVVVSHKTAVAATVLIGIIYESI